jgi:hypothetical protein
VATKSILEIAKSAVPENVRKSGKLVVHPVPTPKATLAGRGTAAAPRVPTTADIAARVALKLGVKTKKRAAAATSGDVEFVEKTRLGKRSIVVQVRGGKVKQILKRA